MLKQIVENICKVEEAKEFNTETGRARGVVLYSSDFKNFEAWNGFLDTLGYEKPSEFDTVHIDVEETRAE